MRAHALQLSRMVLDTIKSSLGQHLFTTLGVPTGQLTDSNDVANMCRNRADNNDQMHAVQEPWNNEEMDLESTHLRRVIARARLDSSSARTHHSQKDSDGVD